MFISKCFTWIVPYLEAVKDIVPLNTLDKIIAVRPSPKKIQQTHARLVTITDSCTGGLVQQYISINLSYFKTSSINPPKRVKRPFSKIDILSMLAHELAHLIEQEHSPRHKIVECSLCTVFMDILARSGYVSEENELSTTM